MYLLYACINVWFSVADAHVMVPNKDNDQVQQGTLNVSAHVFMRMKETTAPENYIIREII